ncbi:hypothetical protein GOBAR_DD05717 [Gossypium barbadense]|nr:hypothetical protein GOBAR_DD05717 [Gossypium barbadense]
MVKEEKGDERTGKGEDSGLLAQVDRAVVEKSGMREGKDVGSVGLVLGERTTKGKKEGRKDGIGDVEMERRRVVAWLVGQKAVRLGQRCLVVTMKGGKLTGGKEERMGKG